MLRISNWYSRFSPCIVFTYFNHNCSPLLDLNSFILWFTFYLFEYYNHYHTFSSLQVYIHHSSSSFSYEENIMILLYKIYCFKSFIPFFLQIYSHTHSFDKQTHTKHFSSLPQLLCININTMEINIVSYSARACQERYKRIKSAVELPYIVLWSPLG